MKKLNPIIQWWLTPKFPLIHLNDKTSFIKKWLFHPIKRRLARFYLKFLQMFTPIKVIGITGSAGKTTTKEMLASILSLDGKTAYSKDNIDPIYNIPTTILSTSIGTKYLILEMGVEYPGEMDFYLWLARPDIGAITNIFPTHLEFLKDIKGVLEEKSKLVLSLDEQDVAILNLNDKLLKDISIKIKAKIEWFKSINDQNIDNATLAATIADYLSIPKNKIMNGLKISKRPQHRLSFFRSPIGAVILDDSYNSNPQALLSTLKLFGNKAGKNNKIAVLGEMKELGKFEEKFHRDIGRVIAKQNFQAVIGIGGSMKYLVDEINKSNNYTKAVFVNSLGEAISVIKPYLIKDNYILIKGSHSVGLDKLADTLV